MSFKPAGKEPATLSADQLRAYIERIEKMEEEKRAILDDIKDIYAEIKGAGFDAPIIKQIVKLRAMDRDKRMEMEAILDLYLSTLGMD